MDERERGVAAEDDAPLPREPVAERLGEALDPDDRRHAERDADEKDPQAREAAAQVAQREAQDRRAAAGARRSDGRVHAGTSGRVLDRARAHPDDAVAAGGERRDRG